MGLLKKIAISSLIIPFFLLTASFCCFKMMPGTRGMADCCSSMAASGSIGHGINFHSTASHSSNCHCEQLTESYDKAGLKSVDLNKSTLNNPKAITFSSQTFTRSALAVPFFNYHSPPKVVQNPLPLYLQLAVLRI